MVSFPVVDGATFPRAEEASLERLGQGSELTTVGPEPAKGSTFRIWIYFRIF